VQAFLLNLHLIFVWPVLLAGVVSLIIGLILLIDRWRQLAPISTAQATAQATTNAEAIETTAAPETAEKPAATPAPPQTTLQRAFRWSLIATAALGAIQVAIGGLVFASGERPNDPLHYVYGAIVLLSIPIAYVYSDQKQVRRDIIIMTIAVVAVIGAATRAFMTGIGLP